MQDMIVAAEFCTHHNVEYSFISTLNEYGLIEVTTVEETRFIPCDELPKLERLVRLHDELDINLEGLQAISYLLQKIENMQQEIMHLKNRLRLYEMNG